ncbi:MAG: amidase [Alphaproteobacteria bacterium]
MDHFFHLDATAQAALVKSGAVSPTELMEAAIARIEALNGSVNAVTLKCYEQARKQAQTASLPQNLTEAPFAGVPFLIKDLAAMKNLPVTYGSRLFAKNTAWHNEAIVARTLQAGFLIAGKTNTAEFGLLPTTEPMLFGPTRNPWNLEYSAGGSSGGAAAAVASGMVPVAQGGDGGGSIRIPASCCGLFGLKPSRGRTVPLMRKTAGDLAVNLCLSRSVRDSARFLQAAEISGRNAAYAPLGFVEGPSKRRLRIAYSTRNMLGSEAEPEVKAALDDVVALCASLGHSVEEADIPVDGEAAVKHFVACWAAGPAKLLRYFWLMRLKTWFTGTHKDVLEPWTLELAEWYEREEQKSPGLIARAIAFFQAMQHTSDEFFSRYDVHLTPVLRRLPVRIGEFAPDTPFDDLLAACVDHITYTPLHNAMGTPAMSVPLSWSANGLPIGSQFAAQAGDERTLLELAYELEEARAWADKWPPISAGAKDA